MKEKISVFLSLQWVVVFVRFLTKTAGNIAESVFILASLWVIVNMVAHQLMLESLGASEIGTINQLALIAFSALPELIFVAVLEKTLSLLKNKVWIWGLLYAVPCIIFAGLTINVFYLFTSSSGNVKVVVDPNTMVFRVVVSWFYAVVNAMFDRMVTPNLISQNNELKNEINRLKSRGKPASKAVVATTIKPSNWLIEQVNTGVKTIELNRLIEETGVSKRELNREIKAGNLETDRRAPSKIRMRSIAEWLEIPMPIGD